MKLFGKILWVVAKVIFWLVLITLAVLGIHSLIVNHLPALIGQDVNILEYLKDFFVQIYTGFRTLIGV